jgi:hypothetical protein
MTLSRTGGYADIDIITSKKSFVTLATDCFTGAQAVLQPGGKAAVRDGPPPRVPADAARSLRGSPQGKLRAGSGPGLPTGWFVERVRAEFSTLS